MAGTPAHTGAPARSRNAPDRLSGVSPGRSIGSSPAARILAAKVPEGDGWLHELKHDDYRRACAPLVAKRA